MRVRCGQTRIYEYRKIIGYAEVSQNLGSERDARRGCEFNCP